MLLTIGEQILLMQSMPSSGTINRMKAVRAIKPKLYVDREWLRSQVMVEGQIDESKMDELNTTVSSVELTNDEINLVKLILFELSKQGKITEEHLSLCEKFEVE